MKKTNVVFWLTAIALLNGSGNVHGAGIKSTLSPRQQGIVRITANASVGNMELLEKELNSVLDAGMTINEVQEVMVHLYAYAGFPRSLRGLGALAAVVAERKGQGHT